MKTILISQPLISTAAAAAITNFHRHLFLHTTTSTNFPAAAAASSNQIFHFPGDVNFTGLRCRAHVHRRPSNKDVNEQQATVENDSHKNNSTFITNSQETDLLPNNDIKKYIIAINSIFNSMDDGAISPSAYDTAWVALIQNVNGGPQFPSSLEWIANNQHADGSWSESFLFSAYDRLVNTLTCVIALTTWNLHPDKCQKGMKFVYENLNKVADEKEEHMTPGFELVFPSLIELAQRIDIKMPHDSLVLKEIYAKRDKKLTKIPKDIFHKTPTIMLYSLEGMKDLEWEKILKLQCENGSIVFSPAPTAFAYMQTKNKNCLAYLTNLVAKFNGGVPNIHPSDLFERSWMVDRLQRLGITRYFQNKIKDCLNHIHRYWDGEGVAYGRNCNLPDLDCTAMAFRVLRTNGYQVNSDVFRHFENDGEFMCFRGQPTEGGLTVMFNLYRASQLLFPVEKIMDDAKNFSHKVLTEKRSTNKLLDRWIITKDLSGEVGYALDIPWYASLPRLETKYYLEQYGGENDVWIAKVFYRMKSVSNNIYLEMAKLDYNHCQTIHQLEWSHIKKWHAHLNIEESLSIKPLWSYYEAAASIFEPERRNERVAWAKTAVLLDTIASFFATHQFSNTDVQGFVDEFTNPHHNADGKSWHVVMNALREFVNEISSEVVVAHGVDILPHLHSVWKTWLLNRQKGVEVMHGEAELIVQTIILSSGRCLSEEILSHPQYERISSITNDICHQISRKEHSGIGFAVESKMQHLVQLVFCDSPEDLDLDFKQTFLVVAKTFYYRAYFNPETIESHIDKVLFESAI